MNAVVGSEKSIHCPVILARQRTGYDFPQLNGVVCVKIAPAQFLWHVLVSELVIEVRHIDDEPTEESVVPVKELLDLDPDSKPVNRITVLRKDLALVPSTHELPCQGMSPVPDKRAWLLVNTHCLLDCHFRMAVEITLYLTTMPVLVNEFSNIPEPHCEVLLIKVAPPKGHHLGTLPRCTCHHRTSSTVPLSPCG